MNGLSKKPREKHNYYYGRTVEFEGENTALTSGGFGLDPQMLFLLIFIFKEDNAMWKNLGIIATIGGILFGILGTVCDCKDLKDKIQNR